MTEQSKTFDQFYPILKNYLHKNKVVCHNTDFDLDVLSKTMAFYGIEDNELDFDYHCTLKLYNGNGLKVCCKELNIKLDHHNPLSDAEACAELFLRLNSDQKACISGKFRNKYSCKKNEKDDEEFNQYYFKSEAINSINKLKGILLGIMMDQNINEKEITELQIWSENQFYLIDHILFKKLMQLITETTDCPDLNLSTIEDMLCICKKFEADYYNHFKSYDLIILQGIFHGILADGILKDIEILELKNWLSENVHLAKLHPFDEVYSIVKTILADGIIEEAERKRLKSFIYNFVELTNKVVDQQIKTDISEIPLNGICAINPEIVFYEKLFCLTGNFEHGEKQFIEELIKVAGGNTKPNFVKGIDYLVVGSLGERSWAYNAYGTKIAKALKLQKDGGMISIVHENDFWNLIQNNIN